MASFITSLLSASYGLANYLRIGPLKVIPNRPFSGFGHFSFWLIMLSNGSSLVAKGYSTFRGKGFDYGLVYITNKHLPKICGVIIKFIDVLLSTFTPSFLLSLITLTACVGFRNFLKLAIRDPTIVMLPVFTPFMFGLHTKKTMDKEDKEGKEEDNEQPGAESELPNIGDASAERDEDEITSNVYESGDS